MIEKKIFSFSRSPQNILFGDDTEQSAIVGDQSLTQAQLPEHVHHSLHGSLKHLVMTLKLVMMASLLTWSVMVIGARSTIFLSLRGGGPLPTTGMCCVNTHSELPGSDSSRDLAFSKARSRSLRSTNPTRY